MNFFNFQFLLLIFLFLFFTEKGHTQSFDNLILFRKKADKRLTFKKGKKVKILCDMCDKPILIGNLKGRKAENIFLESLDIYNIRDSDTDVFLKIPIEGVQSIAYHSRFKDSKSRENRRRIGNFLLIASSIGLLLSWYPAAVIPEFEGEIQPLNTISRIGFGLGLGIRITSAKRKFTVGRTGKWYIP